MARIITKELAERIVKKLDGRILRPQGAHDLWGIFFNEKLVASFGIRRGSEKDKGHDHVSGEIHLSPHKARLLGQCPMTDDEWVAEMRQKGIIE